MTSAITVNPVAKNFFVYLLLLLAAILGQDVLLEPFGAQAFGMTLEQTSRIVSITNTSTLIAFIIAGVLDGRVKKKYVEFGYEITHADPCRAVGTARTALITLDRTHAISRIPADVRALLAPVPDPVRL